LSDSPDLSPLLAIYGVTEAWMEQTADGWPMYATKATLKDGTERKHGVALNPDIVPEGERLQLAAESFADWWEDHNPSPEREAELARLVAMRADMERRHPLKNEEGETAH
jgi:hypothetical protein